MVEKGQQESEPKRSKLIAFKNHLEGAAIEPDVCEIYVFDGGYGGLSRVENGKANLCFIVRADAVKGSIAAVTNGHVTLVASRNARAAKALRGARPVGEWLAVTIGDFGRKERPTAENLVAVGDAAAFIDPFTGSGMLMALESSEVLAGCIGETGISPSGLSEAYMQMHAARFRKRLAASALLRRAAFMPRLATAAIVAAGLSDRLRERLARSTRSGTRHLNERR
jgi:flavin-dependent dehydrogenase